MMFNIKEVLCSKFNKLRGSRTLINGALFSVYSFVNKGIVFLLLILLANYISPDDYGYLSLFNTVLTVLGFIIALSSEGYLGIVFFKDGKEGQRQVISAVSLIITIISILLFAIIFLFGSSISKSVNLNVELLYISVIISFATIVKNMYLDNIRLHEEVKMYGIVSCSNAFLFFILSLVFVIALGLSWQGQIFANLLVSVLYGGYALFYFLRKKYFTINFKKILKPMLIWSIPLIPHAASGFIRQGCDRYIINAFHSIGDVGLFSFALNIANIVFIIGLGFNSSNSVDIYKTLSDNSISNLERYRRLNRIRKLFSNLYLLCSIFIVIAAFIFVPILLPQYADSKYYIIILTVFGYFQCIYLLWTNYLFYYNRTKEIMFITFTSSILHLLLSVWLTRYNLYYTALVYCFTQGIVTLGIKYLAKKELNKRLFSE